MVMGNRGYATLLLEHLLRQGERVVAVCSRSSDRSLVTRATSAGYQFAKTMGWGHADDIQYEGPFDQLRGPDEIAGRAKIPVYDAQHLTRHHFYESLKKLELDVILVAGFHRRIPLSVIQIPRKAIVNFHPSLLPRHRGGTPNRWVIRNGESKTGVTAHFVTEAFDAGDCILQRRIAVPSNATWGELEWKVAAVIPSMALEVLSLIKDASITRVPQDTIGVTQEPSYRGLHTTINWSLSGEEVRRTCYAIRPKSGGITSIGGQRLCIWELKVVSSSVPTNHPPGTVFCIQTNGEFLVACGSGIVCIRSFLYRGIITSAASVVKIFTIIDGSRLGV